MPPTPLLPKQIESLSALANGIIPPDETDGGATMVNAGPKLADKIQSGINARLYLAGLDAAEEVSQETFARSPSQLSGSELHELLSLLRGKSPGFFKQLRMDVSALYLSDPDVWKRIGFPGPSFDAGGYPDFDQPQ